MKKIILATALAATMMTSSVFASPSTPLPLLGVAVTFTHIAAGSTVSAMVSEVSEDTAAGPGSNKSVSPVAVLKNLGIKGVKSNKVAGGAEVASFKAENTGAQVYCMMTSKVNITCMAPA